MKRYVCSICGFVYEEAAGIPAAGIAPGTRWEELPEGWVCPLCKASKSEFQLEGGEEQKDVETAEAVPVRGEEHEQNLRELTIGELSALCSNLAKGCEKQYLGEEAKLFTELAGYLKAKTPDVEQADAKHLLALAADDLNGGFGAANAAAKADSDRGAQRALVWSEKVSRIVNSLLGRYKNEGIAFLENTNLYVCEICGFLYVGDNPPELCPICKVPGWKFQKVERR